MSNISYLKGSKNWNLIRGCQKISSGCKYCWSEAMHKRFYPNRQFTDVQLFWDRLEEPLKWKKPQLIACCFTSDLFQDAVPDEFLARVFQTIRATPQHTYILLTKRAQRLEAFFNYTYTSQFGFDYRNAWFGVSVENSNYRWRCQDLVELPLVCYRWLSLEPLLGPVKLTQSFHNIDWIVVGGESGNQARSMSPSWVYPIRDYCQKNCIPFYFKQWGRQKQGYLLDGQEYRAIPFHKPKED